MKLQSDNLSASDNKYSKAFLVATIGSLLYFYVGAPIFIFIVFYLSWQMRRHLKEICSQTKWLLLFTLYCFIVALFNMNYVGMFIPIAFIFFILYFSIYRRKLTAETYLLLLKTIVIGSILLALHAIIIYVKYVFTHGYDLLYVFKYAAVQTRAESTFFNANYYGLFTIFAIIIAIYLIHRLKDRKWTWLGSLALVLNLITMLLTASRWVLPTLFVAVFVLLSLIDKRWFFFYLVCSISLIILLFIKPELIPRLESLEHGFQDRFALWDVGWKIFLSEPLFGRGAMSYMTFYYLYTDKADMHAHSLYIDSLANYGLLGCTSIGLYLLSYVRRLRDFVRRKDLRPEIALILSMLVTVFFHGLMDVAIFWFQTGYIFLLVILCPSAEWARIPAVINNNKAHRKQDL